VNFFEKFIYVPDYTAIYTAAITSNIMFSFSNVVCGLLPKYSLYRPVT
jgi:hypothetical protein